MDEMFAASSSATALDDLNNRFLTFYIADSVYGIELFNVIEIIKVQPITKVPNVPAYIKGIINLRGKIVPVIDVRLKFGYEEAPYDEKTCIVVVVVDEMQVGLIVDSVSEVATVSQENRTPPPAMNASGSNQYLGSITTQGDRIVLNIDCGKFFFSDLNATDIH